MPRLVNLSLLTPELILLFVGVALLFLSLARGGVSESASKALPWVASLGLIASLAAVAWVGQTVAGASGAGLYADSGRQLRVDTLSQLFKGIAAVSTLIVVTMTRRYAGRFSSPGEFYALLILTTLAAFLLSSAADLVSIYLAMEYLSITSYAMAGYYRESRRSNEAAIKYFLFGALNSALMLYGISMLYGLSATPDSTLPATTNLRNVIYGIVAQPMSGLMAIALVFAISGFLFKVSAVPFHQWAPDTYQGAPTPFTAFLSVTSKVGGLAVLTRVVAHIFGMVNNSVGHGGLTATLLVGGVIAIVSALSMCIGNVIAIQQKDLKRLLAYSGIAQAGYMLVGVAAMQAGNADRALQAVIIYAITYLFMNLGAFAVVVALNNNENTSDLEGLKGLSQRNPLLAAAMAVFLLSLSGIPPFAGWVGKYYIFFAAIDPSLHGSLFWLALVLVVNSVIAAFYYLNIIRVMYFQEPETGTPLSLDGWLKTGVVLAAAFTIVLGVVIAPMYNLATGNAKLRVETPEFTSAEQFRPR